MDKLESIFKTIDNRILELYNFNLKYSLVENGNKITLTKKEGKFLKELFSNDGIITRNEILENLYPDKLVNNNTISVFFNRINKKIDFLKLYNTSDLNFYVIKGENLFKKKLEKILPKNFYNSNLNLNPELNSIFNNNYSNGFLLSKFDFALIELLYKSRKISRSSLECQFYDSSNPKLQLTQKVFRINEKSRKIFGDKLVLKTQYSGYLYLNNKLS